MDPLNFMSIKLLRSNLQKSTYINTHKKNDQIYKFVFHDPKMPNN